MAEGVDGSLGTQIAAANADYYHQVDFHGLPAGDDLLVFIQHILGDGGGEAVPADEIVAGAAAALEGVEAGE